MAPSPTIDGLRVRSFTIPTDVPEADGTLRWDRTTLVLIEAQAGGVTGLGYGYSARATAQLIADTLAPEVVGKRAFDVPGIWWRLIGAVRNLGRPGLGAMAVSPVDVALWDLKARLLGISLIDLLGAVRPAVPAYGSGGFTSYSRDQLRRQFEGFLAMGMQALKMKVGADPEADPERVRNARADIGPDPELFVDANGAYERKQALRLAEAFAAQGATWFEEPVSSDDLEGLRMLRERAPAGMEITAGEYGWGGWYFRRMLDAGAVDVLQPDATRCGGVTGFQEAGLLCQSHGVPFSAHTAPSLHAHLCCALQRARHVEFFHDHARIEQMLFDGALRPKSGLLVPDRGRPGLGLAFKERDAAPFAD